MVKNGFIMLSKELKNILLLNSIKRFAKVKYWIWIFLDVRNLEAFQKIQKLLSFFYI